ncbi:TetR/AcrR family transcriptional regulator [Mycolicibacterium sp. CH28]|uniref:TetR/AcrR family transcriptional regulator n=1 Tax=Mycolicibacterium sp. CH28 TaxID=2512237 RepID=UPI0010805E37|nr:TetR/AcrR family transcriptional regulator [Mycolicibacterium sp. CH28]TGD86532.1 TetR/AcrR family transcriptional regulator [Mycolicibacterium sp. CH28]
MTQARAQATRMRILSAAVNLFSQDGYGDTGLADIQQRAEVTKGAFYYHFDSKEAVAAAVIEECRARLRTAFRNAVDPPAPPGLAQIIRGTFAVARLLQSDDTVRVGNELSQALGQVSGAGSRILRETTTAFIDVMKMAAAAGELRADLDPEDIGEAIWVVVLGCQFLSAAIGDDLVSRLARAWRVLLHGIVPDQSLAHFAEVVERSSREYPPALT